MLKYYKLHGIALFLWKLLDFKPEFSVIPGKNTSLQRFLLAIH